MSKADEIEKHIINLKEYCRIDRENITYEGDFGEFCKGHIEDIEAVLEELENRVLEDNKEEIEELKIVEDGLTYGYKWSEIPTKINELVKAVNKMKKGKE